MKLRRAMIVALASALSFAACSDDPSLEDAGESVDEAIEEAVDEIDDAVDDR